MKLTIKTILDYKDNTLVITKVYPCHYEVKNSRNQSLTIDKKSINEDIRVGRCFVRRENV